MTTSQRPLVVDLDGTLIHTDLLHECALAFIKNKPQLVFLLPFWLMKGKALLKERLAREVMIDVASLPFHHELLSWLRDQKAQGRTLVLCTASDKALAYRVAEHLDLFDIVLASDGVQNLAGKNKASVLTDQFGHKQFDYIGNSTADLAVWQVAHSAIVVSNSKQLLNTVKVFTEPERVFKEARNHFQGLVKALRMHQWIKNSLLFVPLLAAHKAFAIADWYALLLAFAAFSLCASAVYIVNDLLDLESDRQHARKRARPFASGMLPASIGIGTAPVLLLISFGLAMTVGDAFLLWLLIYCALATAYSWRLKQWVLMDCFTLAILYTLRIIAGAAAVNVSLSFWLLAFSIFLFLSLAFIKRFAELKLMQALGTQKAHGRGYWIADTPLIQQLGIASGYAAVMVLALYLNSDSVARLYKTPQMIWAAVPLLLLWLSWMWLKAHRGQMHDDPIVFAIKDKMSWVIGVLFVLTFVLASWYLT